jgi:outer membrane protein W
MIRLHALVAGLVVLSATGSAFAQDGGGSDKKFKLGLRLGYMIPAGKIDGDTTFGGITIAGAKLSDQLSGGVPIQIDAGYMVTPNILVGLYGQYAFLFTKNCDPGASCSAHDVHLGVQAQYHIMPDQSVDPWLGLGVGYEWLVGSESGSVNGSATTTGLELLNLQGGADFQAASAFTVGPFLSLSLGQYSSVSSNGNSADITNKALHEWITVGAKGTFGL